jgi:hypothetical protein
LGVFQDIIGIESKVLGSNTSLFVGVFHTDSMYAGVEGGRFFEHFVEALSNATKSEKSDV